MRIEALPTLLVAALFAASSVSASESTAPEAMLTDIEGTVLVNQGERFVNVHEATALVAGDRVLLMSGASAGLVWADGCELPLVAESMLSIGAQSPCLGETAEVTQLGPMLAQAVADTGTVARAAGDTDSYTWLILGGIGLVAVLAASGGGSSSTPPPPPVSP